MKRQTGWECWTGRALAAVLAGIGICAAITARWEPGGRSWMERAWWAVGMSAGAAGVTAVVSSRRRTAHSEPPADAARVDPPRWSWYDPLTHLPTRAFLTEMERRARAEGRAPAARGAMLLVDLDRFGVVNNGLGHHVGDEVLAAVAGRLEAMVPEDHAVARVGGDEFAILGRGLGGEEAIRLADALIGCLAEPLPAGPTSVYLTASVGIAPMTPSASPADALRHAEIALHRAKQSGPGQWELFRSTMADRAAARLRLETDLRRAIATGELGCAYQPIAHLDSGRVAGVEALVRWLHPELGPVAASDLVSVAEESGLIVPVGRWVLTEACRQARRWEAEGLGDLQVSVNLSGRQFHQRDLVSMVADVLVDTGIDPGRLTLEITETVAMDDLDLTASTGGKLAALGVQIALDDFGQGSSSLAALRRFPLHEVKIDKAFVAGVASDGPDRAIVASMLAMADALDIEVVAEGIETAAQLAALRSMGSGKGQGFHLARPVAGPALADTLVAVESRVSVGQSI